MTGPDGRCLDAGDEPVHYLHGGHGGILAKLEAALDGKGISDTIQVTLEPEDAFGPRDPGRVFSASLDSFAAPPALGAEVEWDAGGASP